MAPRTVVAGIGVAVVLLAIVIGLAVIGSPADERARRLDERRVRALQGLAVPSMSIGAFAGRVPQSIAELMRDPGSSPTRKIRSPDRNTSIALSPIGPTSSVLTSSGRARECPTQSYGRILRESTVSISKFMSAGDNDWK